MLLRHQLKKPRTVAFCVFFLLALLWLKWVGLPGVLVRSSQHKFSVRLDLEVIVSLKAKAKQSLKTQRRKCLPVCPCIIVYAWPGLSLWCFQQIRLCDKDCSFFVAGYKKTHTHGLTKACLSVHRHGCTETVYFSAGKVKPTSSGPRAI